MVVCSFKTVDYRLVGLQSLCSTMNVGRVLVRGGLRVALLLRVSGECHSKGCMPCSGPTG